MRATGLLKKAQSLRGRSTPLRVLGPHELRAEQDDEITPEEREKVLAQIDEAVSSNRLKITEKTFEFSARRKGGVLPAVVNAAAILVIAAGIFLALYLSRRAEHDIVAPPVTILSAEGKMVEALKAESQAQLAGKDREISAIRDRIAGFDSERARIRSDADALVSQKERELQDSFKAALDAERKRLEASGLSATAVSDRIDALQAKNNADMEAQLAAFRARADADSAAKEKAIAALQSENQKSLAQAQADRAQLQADAARQQADLEAGYKQKQLALEKDSAAAQAELTRLRDQQAGQQLVLDQILSWYQKARDQIQAGKPDSALGVLTDFRAYLNSQNLASLPAVTQRRPVDLFLIDSLEELVHAQAGQLATAANVQGLVASANLIAAVAAIVQTGDDAFQSQAYAKARELYLSALAKIPAVQAGYAKLVEIESLFADQKNRDISVALAAGNSAYRSGDYTGAAGRYAQALTLMQGDRAAADTLVSQLADIGALRKAAEDAAVIKGLQGDAAARARTAAFITALQSRLAVSGPTATEATSARNALVALLETKLLVQKALLGADVVKQYPTLFDDLNRYLDALAAQSGADARLETLRDLDALLGSVSGQGQVPEDVLKRYASRDQQALLLSILNRLQALVK